VTPAPGGPERKIYLLQAMRFGSSKLPFGVVLTQRWTKGFE